MPMNTNRGAVVLRMMDNNTESPAPNDKLLIIKTGTNAGSTQAVNVADIIKPGASVWYFQFKPGTVSATGTLTSAAAIAGATDVVYTLIIADPNDVAIA